MHFVIFFGVLRRKDSNINTAYSLPDTLQNEATFQTQLSRSEHPEPVEGRSRRLLRQAQDASARLVEKVSGSESPIRANRYYY